MRAGDLRHRLTLEVPDNAGANWGSSTTWSTFATVWGDIKTPQGAEFFEGGKQNTDANPVVTIRYIKRVKSYMRFDWEGRKLYIQKIADPDGTREKLEITCRETVDVQD